MSDKDPNSSTSSYSTLVDKVSSARSCVDAWKRRYADVDRSHITPPMPTRTTSVAAPSTSQKTCVEPWENPCGTPTITIPIIAFTAPQPNFEHEINSTISTIDEIKTTVRNVADYIVRRSTNKLLLFAYNYPKIICVPFIIAVILSSSLSLQSSILHTLLKHSHT